jgi:hypothetical protein
MNEVHLLLRYKRKNCSRHLNKCIPEYKNDATLSIIKSKYGVSGSTMNNHKSTSKVRNVDGRTILLRNHQ